MLSSQRKQVMRDLNIEVVYALSPQAKGKIERPYRWLQDHLVRTCVREGVTNIEEAREVLKQEVNDYNWKRVHSTTHEIPMRRFAVAGVRTLFRTSGSVFSSLAFVPSFSSSYF